MDTEIITQNSNTPGIQEDINNNNSPVIENQNEKSKSPIQQVNPPASSTPQTESEIDEKSIGNRDSATEVGKKEDKKENQEETNDEIFPIKKNGIYKPEIEPVDSSKRDDNSDKIKEPTSTSVQKPTVKKSEPIQQKSVAQPTPAPKPIPAQTQPKKSNIPAWCKW